jgi:hypothetical protein
MRTLRKPDDETVGAKLIEDCRRRLMLLELTAVGSMISPCGVLGSQPSDPGRGFSSRNFGAL